MPDSSPRPIPTIFVGGLIVGVLDLAYAMVVYSPHHPLLIPRHIATGVLGPAAYNGGVPAIVLGVVLHFVIALGAATVFFLATRYSPLPLRRFLLDRAIVSGMIFGACVYVVMHYIVLPLSAVPHLHPTPTIYKVTEFIEHWFVVGIPISLSVRHYSR